MKKIDCLLIAKKKFNSRLIVGTGKYKNMSECAKAVKLSGAEIVTVAVRRVNILNKNKPLLMDYIDPKKITYLPNTAGCFTSFDALRTLRLAREIGGWKLVKLEVLGDKKNLFPDMIETLKSTEILTKEGFRVMVYCSDDPSMANEGINSWVEQVSNAVNAVDIMVGDDLELFDIIASDIFEKLIDGRYHPDNMWFEGQLYGDDNEDY